ncbi:hypothetical protein G7Y89_g11237 [Cudoniella acicularis]|uniref:Pentatricopeptide repeat domain-containing protein n=1 Tax=Cudoniella acicularis TaxID=354080 RepID=A0A8H4VY80_9HELO|nr:hypothetical protein G7Y89_g11237 [Cudoniella acicularis]
MQTIWSRAAQAKSSCRCSSCLHTATTLARRATTAVSKRRVTAGDVFTAFYSTILATAAVADARKKDERRKEWDLVIAKAKAGLPIDDSAVPPRTEGQARSELVELKHGEVQPTDFPASSIPRGQLHQTLRMLKKQLKVNNEISSNDSQLFEHNGVQYDKDDFRSLPSIKFNPRDPKKSIHLEKMEENVRNLVNRLLSIIKLSRPENLSRSSADSGVSLERRQIAGRIAELRASFYTSPAYAWKGTESAYEQRTSLHRALSTLLSKVEPGHPEIEIVVAKICYNLLVSTVPPSIATYNILIREFTRLQRPDLTEIVVKGFLSESVLKPNERTVRLILDHYITSKDFSGFRAIVRRMRGLDLSMKLKRMPLDYVFNEEFPNQTQWAMTHKVIHRGNWLYQKMDRTTGLFDTLLNGALELNALSYAVRFIRAALREGHEVQTPTLVRAIQACVIRSDYKAGIKLLNAILSAWEESLHSKPVQLTSDLRWGLHRLLALCGFDSSTKFQALPSLHPIISQEVLRTLLRHMRLESISDSLGVIADRLCCVELALTRHEDTESIGSTDEPNHSSAGDEAFKEARGLLNQYSKTDKWHVRRQEARLTERRRIILQSISARLANQAKWIEGAVEETKILFSIYRKLSAESRKTYNKSLGKRSRDVTVAKQLTLLSKLLERDKELAMNRATLSEDSEVSVQMQEERDTVKWPVEQSAAPELNINAAEVKEWAPLHLPAPQSLPIPAESIPEIGISSVAA